MRQGTSNPEGAPVGTLRRGRDVLALWAFPLILWFLATCFLLGDLGLWNDDWMYIQRIPETGAVRSLILDHEVHYWRPLYRVLAPSLATLLSEHQRFHHLIGAMWHGLVALLLGLLLWRLGIRRLACALGAMVFLVFPWPAEVVFWLSSFPTSLSAAIMLSAMHLAVWWGRGRGGWWIVAATSLLCFIACCLNEQPAMLFGALPLAYVCATDRMDRGGMMRAAALLIAGAVAVGVYAALHAGLAPGSMDIGAGHGVLPITKWPGATAELGHWAHGFIFSGRWFERALQHATEAARAHPARAASVAIVAAVSTAWWMRAMSRLGHRIAPDCQERSAQAWLLALLGMVMIALMLVPIIATRYWLMPRILYPPTLGLSVLVAALVTLVSRVGAGHGGAPAWVRGGIAAAAAAGFMVLACAMVGMQEGYQRRARMDRDLLEQLRVLVPDPAPRSVFVPARVAPPRDGNEFDRYYLNVLGSWWSARWAVRMEYHRSDLQSTSAAWGGHGWRFPAFDGVRVGDAGRVPWDRVIPFEVDEDNVARLVTEVRFQTPSGRVRTERVPQTAAIAERRGFATIAYEFPTERVSEADAGHDSEGARK